MKNIETYLTALGFVKNQNGKFTCVHSEPMLKGEQEIEFCLKELIGNYEGTQTLLNKHQESN
jgi:hypothetical protein